MTERHPSVTTPSAIHNNALYFPPTNDAPFVFESADEEPYTIKCICDYSDDDGNTIYCEKCDTWQHIECFYPGRVDDASREDFDHSCADCKPRPLDRRHATERQKIQRQNKSSCYVGDKKIKRPPSKGQKKKSKGSEVQKNGIYDQDVIRNGIHEQQPFMKKSKGNRSSLSINSQSKKSPPYNTRTETNAQPPSPVQTPPHLPINFQVHGYSDNFLTLYNQGPIHLTCTNSFASLSVSNSMTDWLRDQSRLFQDAGVRNKEDVFLNLKVSVDTLKWPELRVERKEEAFQNMILHRQYLITPRQLPQPGRIVELNGLVCFQKDYCSDPENRWTETAHPRPFVFFHPLLPLCIDTRLEGSIGRYVRRSCRSNTSLETFIANGTEYHFWLTSEHPLAANEQITLSWDFRFPPQYRARFLHLLNLGEEDSLHFDISDITQEEYDQLTQTIRLVLSEHGGCACDLGHDCAFARFHRNYIWGTNLQNSEVKSKKVRRTKLPQASPTSLETTTSIRALNETKQDNNDEGENHSTNGSVRSKPLSRDLTPATTNSDNNYILMEPSDREKRKLAALEDSFRKMEQGQPARKKKKATDNNLTHSQSTHTVSKSRQRSIVTSGLPTIKAFNSSNSNSRIRQLDTNSPKNTGSTSLSTAKSDTVSPPISATPFDQSPTSQLPKSSSQKPPYKDSATQTEEVKYAWWRESGKKKGKLIISLARRLLLNRYRKDLRDLPGTHDLPTHSENPSIITLSTPKRGLEVQVRNLKLSSPNKSISPSSETSTIVDLNIYNSISQTSNYPTVSDSPLSWSKSANNVNSKSKTSHLDVPPDIGATFLTPMSSSNESEKLDISSISPLNVVIPSPSPSNSANANNFQQTIINNITQNPSPIRTTKKLSLSDYKAARMKKTDLSTQVPKTPIEKKRSEINHAASKSSSQMTVHELKPSIKLEESTNKDLPIKDLCSISATT
ncbi:putative phd-finger domain-containing protein [Erysiphe necator]|uniref:Putative phd-finger domain-containing protein n=1 Tax=Uncinula necator TaxID=52586 RepID=A0A0B1PE90_UNCNE|nr:putative phd-finger domain-containing protein [Erysiphe necator]